MDLLLLAISVALSLAADIAIDCYFLKNYKITRKNKDNSGQQNAMKNLMHKISESEKQIKYLYNQSNDISKLKQDVEQLKRSIENTNYMTAKSDKENEKIIVALKELEKNIVQLESNRSGQDSVVPLNISEVETKMVQLYHELTYLKQMISNQNQTNASNEQLEQVVSQLSSEVVDLQKIVSAQQEVIQSLQKEKNTSTSVKKTTAQPSPQPIPHPTAKPVTQYVSELPVSIASKVVIPNKKYVKDLISDLSEIEKSLGSMEYEHCKKGFKNILENGDFEDSEEIISSVHEIIKKYIYGSDTKVSADDWIKLEQYIENAGYIAIPVKAGDYVTKYKTYFDRPIAVSGGTPDTIKQIQLKPFVLIYEDSGEKEVVKLCGKCTYYR